MRCAIGTETVREVSLDNGVEDCPEIIRSPQRGLSWDVTERGTNLGPRPQRHADVPAPSTRERRLRPHMCSASCRARLCSALCWRARVNE